MRHARYFRNAEDPYTWVIRVELHLNLATAIARVTVERDNRPGRWRLVYSVALGQWFAHFDGPPEILPEAVRPHFPPRGAQYHIATAVAEEAIDLIAMN